MGSMAGYRVPSRYGDTFFMYAFDGDKLTNGTNALNQRIKVDDGDFISRYWAGADTLIATPATSPPGSIQIYNRLYRPYNSGSQGIIAGGFSCGFPHIPEDQYPQSGYISFDLYNVNKLTIGVDGGNTIYASQLVFAGVRRRQGVASDPMESAYKYYEKPYSYGYSLSINNYASTGGVLQGAAFNSIPILDGYDFVLQRIRVVQTPTGTLENPTPTFKILLYNGNKEQISNIPIVSQRIVNFSVGNASGPVVGAPERNYFPTPGIMYRANSAIQFYTYSLLLSPTVLPVNYDLEFSGVRRYPC